MGSPRGQLWAFPAGLCEASPYVTTRQKFDGLVRCEFEFGYLFPARMSELLVKLAGVANSAVGCAEVSAGRDGKLLASGGGGGTGALACRGIRWVRVHERHRSRADQKSALGFGKEAACTWVRVHVHRRGPNQRSPIGRVIAIATRAMPHFILMRRRSHCCWCSSRDSIWDSGHDMPL